MGTLRIQARRWGNQRFHLRSVYKTSLSFLYVPRGRYSSYFGLFSILEAVWLSFNALKGMFAPFCPKGLFGKIMGYGNSVLF